MRKKAKGFVIASTLLLASGLLISCNSASNPNSGETTNRSYSGTGVPPSSLGVNGDTYTDTETNNIYKKENGVWVIVTNNTPHNYSGDGLPDASLGVNGDKYTNTINGAVYTKVNGTWTLTTAGDTTYTVTFNLNGGQFADGSTTYPDQIVREGRWITAPSTDPIKEHCTFLGWYAEGSSSAWNFVGTSVYGNVDLVAQYSVDEDDKIIVTVNPNNGESSYNYETYVGDYYYPSIPNYTGYSFAGWYVEGTDESYSGYVTSDLAGGTLYAKWEKSKFNVQYQVEANNEVTITGIIDIDSVSLDIPNVISGRKVTKISSKAFNNRISLKTIYIPANVKEIEDGAFRGTRALTQILVDSENVNFVSVDGLLYTKNMQTLIVCPTKAKTDTTYVCPNTLKKIGAYAFYDTKDSGISGITFNEGLEEIGSWSFYNNETISSLNFPSTLKKIDDHAFYGPSAGDDESDYFSPEGVLQTVSFNEGLEEIGQAAFANQYFEDEFTLPSTVKTLGDYAFANCTAITKFTFPAGLENYGNNVFAGCTGILDIAIASGNTHFKVVDGILYNYEMTKAVMCPSGRTDPVTIPEGVTELADYAFYMCDELQDYSFPSTLTRIGKECFAQAYHLTSFVIPDSVTEIGENCFDYDTDLTSVTIGTGLTELPEEAFIETGLTSVEIPGNIKKIGEGAFALCSDMTSLTLGEGVEEIAKSAFYKTSVTSFEMPDTLKSIGDNAFGSGKVTALNVKKNFESLGVNCFVDADGLTTITSISVSSDNTHFSTKSNMLFSKDEKTLYFAAKTAGTINEDGSTYSVSIPEGIETIADYAFAYCRSITSYSFPSTLKIIGEGAFMYSKAPSFTFPSSLRSIGDGAFYFSYATSFTFNDGLESIGEAAFELSDITSVTLPDSLKTLGDYAFCKCISLTSANLGNGVESIGEGAFMNTKLTGELVIPASATSIGLGIVGSTVSTYGQTLGAITVDANNPNYSSSSDGHLLMNKDQTIVYGLACGALSITVPSGVTEIADYGLSGPKCAALKLSLPSTLKTIGYAAFAGLQKVGTLNVPGSVTYVAENAFAYWTSASAIVFKCSRDYAYTNFDKGFLNNCSASVTFGDAE